MQWGQLNAIYGALREEEEKEEGNSQTECERTDCSTSWGGSKKLDHSTSSRKILFSEYARKERIRKDQAADEIAEEWAMTGKLAGEECQCIPCEPHKRVIRRNCLDEASSARVRRKNRYRKLAPEEEEERMGMKAISILTHEETEAINAVGLKRGEEEWQGYKKIEVLVDSGAVENVANSQHLSGYPVAESVGARSNLHYLVEDGGRIPNLEEQRVKVITEEGHLCGLTFQTADLTRPILRLSKMTNRGHDVQFHKKGGAIANSITGQVARFAKAKGAYIVTMWLVPAASPGEGESHRAVCKSSFTRPGR
jgi:hypothetical protein